MEYRYLGEEGSMILSQVHGLCHTCLEASVVPFVLLRGIVLDKIQPVLLRFKLRSCSTVDARTEQGARGAAQWSSGNPTSRW